MRYLCLIVFLLFVVMPVTANAMSFTETVSVESIDALESHTLDADELGSQDTVYIKLSDIYAEILYDFPESLSGFMPRLLWRPPMRIAA